MIKQTALALLSLAAVSAADPMIPAVSERGDTLLFSYTLPKNSGSICGNAFTRLTIGNSPRHSVSGEPAVPYIPLRIVLPEGKEIDQISVKNEERDTLSLQFPVERAPRYGVPGSPESSEEIVFTEDSLWPSQVCRYVGTQQKKGNSVVTYQLFPVQVEPKRAITASSFQVEVVLKESRKSRSAAVRTRRRLNENELIVANTSSLSRSTSRGTAQYLAITADSLAVAGDFTLDTLLALHRSRGLTTKLITVEKIAESYSGRDLQEQIRNAIIDHYNNEGTEFVLLAGDTPIIPARKLYMDEAPSSFKKGVVSDLYYSCLDGDFNSDGDELWGESTDGENGEYPDLLSEVHVGRFSVENREELANIVEKTVAHLKGTRNRAILLAGEKLGFGGVSEYAEPSLEELWNGGEANGYLTRSFGSEPSLQKKTIYAQNYPSNKWTDTVMINAINTNEVGVINHLGHGLAGLNLRLNLNSPDKLALIKNPTPLFVFSQACLSGSFHNESISEYLTTGTPYGMWGGIWNSDNGLGAYESTDSPSQFMNRHFWDALFGKGISRVGAMNSYSHEAAYEQSLTNWAFRWSSYITNLQGDPAADFALRSSEPVITLDSLGENQIWDMGHQFTISWYDNVSTPLSLELLRNGETVLNIAGTIDTVQAFEWTIPETVTPGHNYQLRLFDPMSGSESISELFSIDPQSELNLTAPTGDAPLLKGETCTISWEDNLSETVSLYLLYDNEIFDTIATAVAAEMSSFEWSISLSVKHDSLYAIAVQSDKKGWLNAKSELLRIFSPTVDSYPFADNFDSYEKGGNIGFWSQDNGDSFDWRVHSGATPSRAQPDDWWNSTGPANDVSGSGNYIYCEATGHEGGKSAGLFSAPFDIEGLKNGTLSFRVHMYNKEDYGNMGSLTLYLIVDGEYHQVVSMSGAKGDSWIEKSVDLTPYSSNKRLQAYFKMRTGKSFASDIAIDEFSITGEKGPTSILGNPGKGISTLCAVVPPVITDETELTLQLPASGELSTGVYSLYDVVGNRVVQGTVHFDRNGRATLPVPYRLGLGSYLLVVKTGNETVKTYRAIIGKKEQ